MTTDRALVMVVDDDITLRQLLVIQFDKLGIKADAAFNGIDALKCVRSHRYKLGL